MVSSVFGGVALTHDAKMAGKLKEIERGFAGKQLGVGDTTIIASDFDLDVFTDL